MKCSKAGVKRKMITNLNKTRSRPCASFATGLCSLGETTSEIIESARGSTCWNGPVKKYLQAQACRFAQEDPLFVGRKVRVMIYGVACPVPCHQKEFPTPMG